MQTHNATVSAVHLFNFGQGENAPDNINDYLGRLVVCYHSVFTVVAALPSATPARRMDGSLIPGAARLFIARERTENEDGKILGPMGHWIESTGVARPGQTITHWHHNTDHREPPELCADLYRRAMEAEEKRRQALRRADEERLINEAAHEALWAKHAPDWAKGYLVAELMQDDSDIITDYFSSHAVKVVLLGFSRHDRKLFPEMRKLAATFQPTAELAATGEEHREDYSGGHGLYLAGERGKYSGWNVRKRSLKWGRPRGHGAVVDFSHWLAQQGLNKD